MLFAVLAYLASAGSMALSSIPCDLNHLTACSNANELVWTKSFDEAVRRFLGSRRASYFGRRGPVADQMLEALGGPPDDVSKIGNRFRFTACRARSCPEKGAAVLEPDGSIVALAILHSACGDPHPTDDCLIHDTVTIFVRGRRARDVLDNLSSWAKSEVAREYTAPGMPPERLDAIEVKDVK